MRKLSNDIPLSFLVSNNEGLENNLAKLGFTPEIYSPLFSLVDADLVSKCKAAE